MTGAHPVTVVPLVKNLSDNTIFRIGNLLTKFLEKIIRFVIKNMTEYWPLNGQRKTLYVV